MNLFVASPPSPHGFLAVIRQYGPASAVRERLAKEAAFEGKGEDWYWTWARRRASVRYPRFIASFSGFRHRLLTER